MLGCREMGAAGNFMWQMQAGSQNIKVKDCFT
jgi:hypothetical protein